MFVHFGLYAVTGRFTGITWIPEGANPLYSASLDPVDPALFDPRHFDAEQWVAAARSGGAGYLMLTAKHHDGFCLWPTATSPHSLSAGKWRGGKGDLVGELARACRSAGLPFGLYLSPWDAYAFRTLKLSDAEYDRYYLQQLTELLTGYGEICEVWWDGAGSANRKHDWRAYYRLVRELQPGAVVMGAGCSDVRWIWEVPEEQGMGLDPNRYVVHVPEITPEAPKRAVGMSLWPMDQPGGDYWWPGESYLAMDRYWSGATGLSFTEHLRTDTAHSAVEVVEAWHRTVGYGFNLVVNFVPRPRGDLPPAEVARFAEAGNTLRRTYEHDLAAGVAVTASGSAEGGGVQRVDADLGEPRKIDRVVLQEAIVGGQTVESFRILCRAGTGWRELSTGHTIGHRRVAVFPPLEVSAVRVEMTAAGGPVRLRKVGVYLGAP
jgi:alpha-L-fucosidase